MSLAIGPVSRFMTRSMCTLLETRLSWWEILDITPDARQELEFWKACFSNYNCQHSPSTVRVDASDTAYGGYVVEHGLVWHTVSGPSMKLTELHMERAHSSAESTDVCGI